jgi:hypothetical protein
MKKSNLFHLIMGILLGGVIFGGAAAYAAGILAQPKTAAIIIDGQTVDLKGYIIEDAHYFQLRDLSEKLKAGGKDFSAVWDGQNNRVLIDTSRGYDPNEQYIPPDGANPNPDGDSTGADGSGRISDVKLTEKTIDGRELSREDFSQQANQSIFTGIYTRGVYNAIRQSIVDRDKILPGNDSEGFNPYYSYANFVDKDFIPGENEIGTAMALVKFTLWGRMSSYYTYTFGVEPYIKGYYNYPGYGIVKAYKNTFLEPANAATDSLIQEVSALSDREKIVKFANVICDRMTYGTSMNGNGLNELFTSSTKQQGICSTFTGAFLYLCQRANIPCITVSDYDHAWSSVYVDGNWLVADVTNYSTSRDMKWLMTETYSKQDRNPSETRFLQEILIPNSTN